MLGAVIGIAIAICGYKPYEIEAEYVRNVEAGLPTTTGHTCTAVSVINTETL